MRAERCSVRSTRLGESIAGTASVVRTWLLLEHAAPWPRAALASTRLLPGLGPELARRANQHRVRVVLIRRHGRPEPVAAGGAGPACFVASTRRDGSWIAGVSVDSVEDVLDLDFSSLDAGRPPGSAVLEEPMFLVCTHGRHDPCCAERGRPVAAALDRQFPSQTWEVSHIGGDRFAANLVCLPDGDYFGRVTSADAAGVVSSYAAGRYSLTHLRGRCCYPPPVQAAEVLVRQRLGIDRRGAARVVGWRRDGAEATIRLDVEGHGRLLVRLGVERSAPARQLTCHSAVITYPPRYSLVNVEPVDPEGPRHVHQ